MKHGSLCQLLQPLADDVDEVVKRLRLRLDGVEVKVLHPERNIPSPPPTIKNIDTASFICDTFYASSVRIV